MTHSKSALNIIECETVSNIKTTPRFEKTIVSVGKYELHDPEEENIMDTSDEINEQDPHHFQSLRKHSANNNFQQVDRNYNAISSTSARG